MEAKIDEPQISAVPKLDIFAPKAEQSSNNHALDNVFATPNSGLQVKKATRLDIRSRSPSPTVSTPG
jgi:hypothetical protein